MSLVSLGPPRVACTRCRFQKRRCDNAQPSCSLCTRLSQLCTYEDSGAATTLPQVLTEGASVLRPEAPTPSDIKTKIIASLSSTNPQEIIATYSETTHTWFSVFSQSALSRQYPKTWDTVSVDFALLCFGIVLLYSTPRESQQGYVLHSDHRSMYLMSKNWISLLEGAGFNSVDFLKARLLINIFEVSHGMYPAAYISIAATVRAADALSLFQQQVGSQLLAENDTDENRIIWCGIAILDRYVAAENGKLPSLTRGRPIPPGVLVCNPLCLLSQPSTSFSRLYEASSFLDRVHTVVHQPVSDESFNLEDVTTIVRTIQSFETVVNNAISGDFKVFSSCLALSSTALLLVFDIGSKTIVSDVNTSLNTVIDDVVRRTTVLDKETIAGNRVILPFVTFLLYKAAAITTRKLQADVEPEENLQRLKVLRSTLKVMAQRWLSGDRYLNLLNEDTTPRVLRAVGG